MTHLYARLSGALLLLLLLAAPARAVEAPPSADAIAHAAVTNGVVTWAPTVAYVTATVEVTGPQGVMLRRQFDAGQLLALDTGRLADGALPDGAYEYELTLVTGEGEPSADGEPTLVTATQRGGFEVADGRAVDAAELPYFHTTNGSISGSLCVGIDCAANESFGFDTIRLKENNLRIHFQDTSTAASFPTTDWEIRINDSTNGGASYFGIVDRDTGRRVFAVEAGAPSNALHVEDSGEVGIGTVNPVADVHIVEGDSPTVRLEQDGSSGFQAQTWDVAGNESNFFVRDATNGSTLPFRIRPGAPSNSIYIDTDGDVGLGTTTPDQRLDVDGGNVIIQENNGGSGGDLTLVRNESAGTPDGGNLTVEGGNVFVNKTTTGTGGELEVDGFSRFTDGVLLIDDYTAALPFNGSVFRIRDSGAAAGAGENILNFRRDGKLIVTGPMEATAFNVASDVNRKESFAPVDVQAVLEGVVTLPLSTWEFIRGDEEAIHLGPMAQDFRAAFGLGASETHISTIDADGVALASIQALHARSEADAARIAELEAANAALEARLARLEALLQADHE